MVFAGSGVPIGFEAGGRRAEQDHGFGALAADQGQVAGAITERMAAVEVFLFVGGVVLLVDDDQA